MDTLDDKEVEGIWRRVKRYIPVDEIKGRNQQEVLQNLESFMRDASEVEGESGSMKRLVKSGFATEEGFGRTKEFEDNLNEWLTEEPEEEEVEEEVAEPSIAELPKVSMFSSGRASISTRRGKRVYSQKNLSVKFSEFRGRKSYYIFNTRTKKRITWGVLTDE
jgi:hypothetical protein